MGIIINFKRFTYIVPKNDIFFATLGRYIPRIIPSIKLIIINILNFFFIVITYPFNCYRYIFFGT